MTKAETVSVFVPTFRRCHTLGATLDSLSAQVDVGAFRLVVVDNDHVAAEGAAIARAWAAANGWTDRVEIVTEWERGLSSCRNRGLATAFAHPEVSAVAMIDDDAVALPDWVSKITEALAMTGADVLGGPTLYEFTKPVPATVTAASMFGVPWRRSGIVPMLRSSNNCTITRRVYEAMGPNPFNTSFSRSGGEDVDFFTRCRVRGFILAWATGAAVSELVPAERCSEAWVLRRHRLSANNTARIDRSAHGMTRALLRQSCLALKETVGGVLKSFSSDEVVRFKARMRFVGVLGRIDGLIGRSNEHY
jgi:glycosyltransferase involved in cell wall biosynthesis